MREDAGERMIDRSIERGRGRLLDRPYIFGIARRGMRRKARRESIRAKRGALLYGGIGKFRCVTKEGKSKRGAGAVEGYRRQA